MLKALAFSADAALSGRAKIYGVCATGAPGVERTLEILKTKAADAVWLVGVNTPADLKAGYLAPAVQLGTSLPILAKAESLNRGTVTRRVKLTFVGDPCRWRPILGPVRAGVTACLTLAL